MKIVDEPGTELLLVFKAMPFIPVMDPRAGTMTHVMNVQRCILRGAEFGHYLCDFPVDAGRSMTFRVDPEAIMMYAQAPVVVAPESNIIS